MLRPWPVGGEFGLSVLVALDIRCLLKRIAVQPGWPFKEAFISDSARELGTRDGQG